MRARQGPWAEPAGPVGREGLPAGLPDHPLSLAFTGSVSLGNVLPTADIAQFKQGVKSVAGKMAVLANGVMNSLQVRLGLLDLGREGEALKSSAWRLATSTTSRHCCWVGPEPERELFFSWRGSFPPLSLVPGLGHSLRCCHVCTDFRSLVTLPLSLLPPELRDQAGLPPGDLVTSPFLSHSKT